MDTNGERRTAWTARRVLPSEPTADSDGIHEADELTEMGIPLVPGRHFMAPGFARIPFGGPPEALHSLGSRLEAWIVSRTPFLGNIGTKRSER